MLSVSMAEASTTTTCPNCGAAQAGRYCPECGQDNRHGRLNAKRIGVEFVQNFTGWDTALGYTLKGLFRAPGAMVSDYVSGRRRRFVNPARFCLLSLALWLLTAGLLGVDALDAAGIKITNKSGSDPEGIAAIRNFIGENLEILLFLALPLRALLLRIFFRRSGRNVAECLVMVLYVAGASYLFGVLLTPLVKLEQGWAAPARPILAITWSYWTALGFFGAGKIQTLWRILLVSLLHVFGTALVFFAVTIPWLWLTGG